MLKFRRAIFCGVGVLAALILSTGTASATSILDYQVTTLGCFNCTTSDTFTNPATDGPFTFNGVTMSNGATDATGFATVTLGTFDRDSSNEGNYSDLDPNTSDFVLQVTFLIPTNINGGGQDEFVATIVANGPGTPGVFDFNNGFTHYTFNNGLGSGSFDFRVNDTDTINKHTTDNPLTGTIENAEFTPKCPTCSINPVDVTAVPEPGSLILLGSGLVAVATGLRRRLTR